MLFSATDAVFFCIKIRHADLYTEENSISSSNISGSLINVKFLTTGNYTVFKLIITMMF